MTADFLVAIFPEKYFTETTLLKAIELHADIQTGERAKQGWGHIAKAGLPMNTGKWRPDPDGMAEMYQSQNMMAVIFDVDGETRSGVKMDNGETAGWMEKISGYVHRLRQRRSVERQDCSQRSEALRGHGIARNEISAGRTGF